jgi:predicted TIM-barrel fold metal-dependent hydrolase
MAQAGVGHTLVVATGTYDDSYIRESARRYPGSFTAIAKLDMADPDALAELSRLGSQPEIGGVRFEWRGDNADPADWLDAPQSLSLWEQADKSRIPVSVAAVRKMEHLRALRKVLERFPTLTVILRRMVQPPVDDGPPYKDADVLFSLAEFPNVYSTFSDLNIEETNTGRSTHQAFFETFIERFGASRLMWASFFPAHRASAEQPIRGLLGYVRVQLGFLDSESLDWLLGESASTLYPSIKAADAGAVRDMGRTV